MGKDFVALNVWRKNTRIFVILILFSSFFVSCQEKKASFTLLPDENTFIQNSDSIQGKIDVLWVIDNSGSMWSSQENLANNLETFIDAFIKKNYDFRMVVTTTDAYLDQFSGNQELSQFRDGNPDDGPSGHRVLTPNTPDLSSVFVQNILQGINGDGDERAFQSFRNALNNPLNNDFLREDAFLSIIILSDEDDFSHEGPEFRGGQYTYENLHTLEYYVEYLDQLKETTPQRRSQRYNVNTIGILDDDCLDELKVTEHPVQKIGIRMMWLSWLTNGLMSSLCGDFAVELDRISSRIIELTTEFFLDREPEPESLFVLINGADVPRLPSEPSGGGENGFRYHEETQSITFHGDFIPDAGAEIHVRFDPVTLR